MLNYACTVLRGATAALFVMSTAWLPATLHGAEPSNPFQDDSVEPAVLTPSTTPTSAKVDAAFVDSFDRLRRSGILDQALGVGDRAVDFELPLANGSNLRLSELWAMGPVVVVYYRGNWCPFCNRQLQGLQQVISDIHKLGGQLIAVSPESADRGLETQAKHQLAFPTLTDQGNKVARDYGIVYRIADDVAPLYDQFVNLNEHNGDRSYELPLAATYVIDSGGVIRFAFVDTDFTQRADPQKIIGVLRRLQRESAGRPAVQPLARR